jgi:GxxExxY protein
MNVQLKDSELTEKIIGCAMRVHSELGNGFQEVIYQRSLDIEMKECGIDCVREYDMPIHYKGHLVGKKSSFSNRGKNQCRIKSDF